MAGAFPSGRSKAVISYSHKDKKYLERLQVQLALYVRTGVVDLWDDTRIEPGSRWYEEIKQALKSAKVAVLLVSADFLASEFIARDELPPMLAAAKQEGVMILSVILGPCLFNYTELAQFQPVNTPEKPLSGMTRHQQDQVWVKVAESIKDALNPSKPTSRAPVIVPSNPELAMPDGANQEKALTVSGAISLAKEVPPPEAGATSDLSSPPSVPLKSKEEYLADGYANAGRGRFLNALAAYNQAIQLDAKFAPAYFGKGDVLMKLERFQEALQALDKTIELEPRLAAAYRRRGFVLNQLRRYTGALDTLQEAIRLDSDHPLAYVGKGDALKESGKYDEALAAYHLAILRDDRLIDAYLGKGDVLIKLGDYSAALGAYDYVLLLDPQNFEALDGKRLVRQLVSKSGRVTGYHSYGFAQSGRQGLASSVEWCPRCQYPTTPGSTACSNCGLVLSTQQLPGPYGETPATYLSPGSPATPPFSAPDSFYLGSYPQQPPAYPPSTPPSFYPGSTPYVPGSPSPAEAPAVSAKPEENLIGKLGGWLLKRRTRLSSKIAAILLGAAALVLPVVLLVIGIFFAHGFPQVILEAAGGAILLTIILIFWLAWRAQR